MDDWLVQLVVFRLWKMRDFVSHLGWWNSIPNCETGKSFIKFPGSSHHQPDQPECHPVLLWFNSPYALLERNLERKIILILLGMALKYLEMTIFWNQISIKPSMVSINHPKPNINIWLGEFLHQPATVYFLLLWGVVVFRWVKWHTDGPYPSRLRASYLAFSDRTHSLSSS